jgi:hypothetical protein
MRREVSRRLAPLAIVLIALAQPACILAGGYSSDRGFYVWPGSLLSIVVIVLLLLMLRRRRR